MAEADFEDVEAQEVKRIDNPKQGHEVLSDPFLGRMPAPSWLCYPTWRTRVESAGIDFIIESDEKGGGVETLKVW